eukprot:Protomagalhaensia_wolfi_Nauph_80__5103@NODE_543_length_2335_cov_33_429007_g404_i0_p1_GENE_NODE_543_length_2335_cov_33_429007_g404_i0NODE_543_length_2335_cov_33_429007_g404_i0_p1_ORF_typecomplete_len432_score66_77Arm/PF00514_23/1_1e03Arm/PF00514_23/2_4Arm/PF00514_23/1_1e03Arm/PF00514_23/33Arm/PF00514_23/0_012Arm_2/PF04826_13/5_9Arm_2/PF04826_13/0_015Adaptin_N/PF01602_20/37Adaptin_N/PF01602_20/0_00051KAP/PF05804_12/0_18KAP/PF05804_12/36_NODE_543_length_2335_cov_33_429007_g404_i08222117
MRFLSTLAQWSKNSSGSSADRIEEMLEKMQSDVIKVQISTLKRFLRNMAPETVMPLAPVMCHNVIPVWVKILKSDRSRRVEYYILRALSHLCLWDPIFVVAAGENGASVPLIAMIRSSRKISRMAQMILAFHVTTHVDVQGLAIALGADIAAADALVRFKRHYRSVGSSLILLRNLTARFPGVVIRPHSKAIISALASIESKHPFILSKFCVIIAQLVGSRPIAMSDAFLTRGICTRLVELLDHPLPSVYSDALAAVQGVSTCDYAILLAEQGAIFKLRRMLQLPRNKAAACRAIGSMTLSCGAIEEESGTHNCFSQVVQSGALQDIAILSTTGDPEVQKAAGVSLFFIIVGCPPNQIDLVVRTDCLNALCSLLHHPERSLVFCATTSIAKILKAGELYNGEGTNPYASLLEVSVLNSSNLDASGLLTYGL